MKQGDRVPKCFSGFEEGLEKEGGDEALASSLSASQQKVGTEI
jgi:hypothetical protein